MNKKGFGLRKELAFVLLFVFCLLISVLGLSQFDVIDGSYSGESYSSLENKLTTAALKYYKDRYDGYSSDTVIINLKTLKDNRYITKFTDEDGVSCNGYVEVVNSNVGMSYIRCFNYKTSGYNKAYE